VEIADSLRDAIAKCQMALRGELLPHQVDAWELWEVLSRASDRLSRPEEHLLYASLMKLIVETVRLQCRWLRYEADELYVDSDIAREKMNGLSMRTLNSIFLKSFHPLVEVEQLTERAMQMGKDHWDELPEGVADEELIAGEFMSYDASSAEALSVLQSIRFEDLLDELEREIIEEASRNGNEVPYRDFISRRGSADFPEMVSRSYLGSFLISQGRIGMRTNGSDLRLIPMTGGEMDRTQTLAIILRRYGGN
jgi:hypothetical protein